MTTPHGPMLLVANTRAGDGRGGVLRELCAILDAEEVAYEVAISRWRGHAVQLARQGVAAGARFVVAVGGDGTVGDVVNGLVDPLTGEPGAPDLVLGAVAAGSGTDFLRTWGLDVPLPRLVRQHLLRPTTVPLDLGRVHVAVGGATAVRLFANVAQVGWGADVVATAARLPRRLGRRRCTAAVVLRLRDAQQVSTTLAVDHTTTEEPVLGVVVANAQFFGGGMKVAPRALPDDGTLNVQSWRGGPRDVVEQLPRVRVGEHLSGPLVREWQSATVAVDAVVPRTVEVDGEVVGTTPARFDVLEHVLRLSI